MSRLRLTAFLGSLLATTVVLALALGPAFSAIPNPQNKKFYGCMNKRTRVVKMLNYPKVSKCPARHKLIKWNAKGNPGPAGPAGPAGPQGPVPWSQITGVPPKVLAGDTTRSILVATNGPLPFDATAQLQARYPVGLDVKVTLIPVEDGAQITMLNPTPGFGEEIINRVGGEIIHTFHFRVSGTVATVVKARVTVWNDSYLSPSAVKRKVKVTFLKNPKNALKKGKKKRR